MSDLTGPRFEPQTSSHRDKCVTVRPTGWLPVKFRIELKIDLLTHKCQRGYAATYLINSLSVSATCNLRVNDDNWLLQTLASYTFARSQSMFLYASPKVWNSLPLSMLEIESLSLVKKRLKAYYFNLAFEEVITV